MKTIKSKVLHRTFEIRSEHIDEEKRTVDISFSSEEPVRQWFGSEILDHKKKSVDLTRLNNGAPFLVNHNSNDLAGVVESAKIDTGDKVGRAKIRFGNSERAKEIFQDVVDKIRTKVSVGYIVRKMVREKEEEGQPTIYRVLDWMPIEISSVPIPADNSVGVGRDKDEEHDIEVLEEGSDFEFSERLRKLESIVNKEKRGEEESTEEPAEEEESTEEESPQEDSTVNKAARERTLKLREQFASVQN